MRRKRHVSIIFLTVFLNLTVLLGGCSPAAGNGVLGSWTTKKDLSCVQLDADGQPTGQVPVGHWYAFKADQTYTEVFRYVTVAVSGPTVRQGQYAVDGDRLILTARLESFSPDPGSPQQAYSNRSIEDETLIFVIENEDNAETLVLSQKDETGRIVFWRCQSVTSMD